MIEPAVMQDVKDRPDEIGNQDGLETFAQELGIGKGLGEVEVIENPKRGDKEENRDGETRGDFKERG